MSTERRSRFLESRAAESRSVERNHYADPAYKGKLYINPDIIPDDIVLGWFPKSSLNEPDYQNVQNKMREKWEIASPEMFPTLMGPDLSSIFGGTPSRFIEREGNVLLMMPKVIWEERQNNHHEETRAVMQQANAASAHLANDEYTPFNVSHNQTSYGYPV